MRGALVVAILLTLAGCGGGRQAANLADAASVERAFRDHGIVLHRLPTSGAEQPAMGVTSSCATRYAAVTPQGTVVVAICDNSSATTSVDRAPAFRRTQGNVVADYSGHDPGTRDRIVSALDALD